MSVRTGEAELCPSYPRYPPPRRVSFRLFQEQLPTFWAFNWVAKVFGRRLKAISDAQAAQRAGTIGQIGEIMSLIEVHKIFGSEAAAARVLDDSIGRLAAIGKDEALAQADKAAVSHGVSFLVNESLFFVGAWLMFLMGYLTLGTLSALQAYVFSVQFSLSSLGESRIESQKAAGAARRILEVLDSRPEIADAPDAVELGPIQGRVRFQDVDFNYAGTPVLRGASFEVKPGETAAFVGATGSGKTTILRLLSRLYDPAAGSVSVDGHDLRHVRLNSLTRQLAIVPQEAALFSGTIRENLLAVAPEAGEERLRGALQAANADFVFDPAKFPDGLDTQVGERGVKLSGGERQRVAIARALLRDPRILLLDEATSALDNESELKVQKALHALMRGRTTFIVAHRLTTVQDADRIFVLDHGKIVESGTHQELLAKKGKYHKLWTAKDSP